MGCIQTRPQAASVSSQATGIAASPSSIPYKLARCPELSSSSSQLPIPRTPMKSQAQLDYEFNNCTDHYTQLSLFLQSASSRITNSIGRELSKSEYSLVYLFQCSNPKSSKHQLVDFENFFAAIDQAVSVLPMIATQCDKLLSLLEDRTSEIIDLKKKVTNLFYFCKSIDIPTILKEDQLHNNQSSSASTFDSP